MIPLTLAPLYLTHRYTGMHKASPGDRLHHSPCGSCAYGDGRGCNPYDLALSESKAEIQSSDPDRRLQLPGVLSVGDPADQEMGKNEHARRHVLPLSPLEMAEWAWSGVDL